jgi:hypothetical protein
LGLYEEKNLNSINSWGRNRGIGNRKCSKMSTRFGIQSSESQMPTSLNTISRHRYWLGLTVLGNYLRRWCLPLKNKLISRSSESPVSIFCKNTIKITLRVTKNREISLKFEI